MSPRRNLTFARYNFLATFDGPDTLSGTPTIVTGWHIFFILPKSTDSRGSYLQNRPPLHYHECSQYTRPNLTFARYSFLATFDGPDTLSGTPTMVTGWHIFFICPKSTDSGGSYLQNRPPLHYHECSQYTRPNLTFARYNFLATFDGPDTLSGTPTMVTRWHIFCICPK